MGKQKEVAKIWKKGLSKLNINIVLIAVLLLMFFTFNVTSENFITNDSSLNNDYELDWIASPEVNAEFPEDNTTNTTTNVIDFTYNVSVYPSDIDNCSLMINDEVNFTDLSNITTGETHNLTVYLPNGEYLWSVNCTANLCFGSEPQACAGQSETRNISVGYVTGSSIRSCYSCENCSLEIENAIPGDTVQLGNDISDYQDTFCINISKADITFDCKGYIISNLTATKNGINVYTSNVTIKNCLIANSSAGIYAGDSIDGKGITNLTIVDTVIQTNTNEDGIYLLNVAESTLDNITITLKGGNGFGVSLVEDGERNVSLNNITNINIVGSSWTGLLIEGPGSGNLIQNLTITDYSYSGISLSDTWNNTLKNVNLTNMWNYGTGLYVSETSDVFLDGSGRQNDPAQYIQDIDESNIIDGLPIKYYDGYYTPCPNNEIIEHNNTYSVIGMVGCWNVTLQNTELIDGLHLYFTENSTVQNLNSSGSLTGIRLWYGSGNYLSNLTLWSDFQGILYYGTTNNTINEADIRNSLGYGMDIWWSDYNTIENSTVISGSYEGVSLDDSQHNTIRNLNITSNSQNGIKLSTYSLSGSHYNNITQCNITSNAVGIYIDTNSIGSNIYDNILNNTLNAQVYNSSNYFNNTKTLGTNIIGGPYIGGNYWSDYYGNDTNSDGIGDDDTYNITTNTYDYLPLVTYTPAQDTAPPNIEFVDPTQPDLTVTSYTNAEANISIIEKELANFKWNWNGTNYSIYDDDLVLMLNFDNNSALGENDTYVVDVSRYGNNGTFYSNGTETHGYTTNGKYDGGWLFDGDGDYIITNTSLPINGNNTFTISVWIKLDDDTHINTIVEKYTFTDGMDLWVNYQTAGKASLILADGVDICVVQSASNVTDNNWHHVVGIRDVATSNLSIYIDGVFENETNSSACNNAGDPQKFISIGGMDSGADGSVDTNYFNGTIDEIRIYNRSLTAEEIRQQYYSTLYKYDTDKWVFYTNQQNLSFGNYTYFGAATDADGNENMTEIRNIEITAPPTIIPFEVLFVDPTPSDMAENNYSNVEVNISITGMENLTKFVWDWNETNYSIYDDDLVLMLNFDNNSALGENDTYVVDISRYGNNGTVYNGTIWTSEGKYEGGYSFDGENDVIVIADSPTLSSRNFTIEAWVKLNELGKDDIIVGKAAEYWLVYNHTELSCDIEKFGLSIFNGTGWKCVSTTNKPSIDTWYYLTAIYNGTDISIYVNSILEGGPVNHQNPSDSVYTLDIGSYSANASSYAFNGTIDEVRMYNRSLTSEEIKQHYYSNLQKYDIDKWAFFINESNVTVGNYTYFGAAQNIEGNENMTEVRNVVMKSFVDIQLVWPEESIKINGREINFTYNVSEQNIVGCTLVLNDQYNETNQTEIATDDYNNISVNLTTGSYTWRVECVNDLGQIASSPTSTFSLSNVYFTLRNYTFTELNRTANSFPIEIINEGPDTATAIYAENSTGIELVASSFIGPGSYDIRLTLSPENYFNLTYGANLAQAQTETYVIPIRLMDENGILLDESEIELYLKAFGNYSLASEPSNWTISPDLTDNTTVCSTTKLNITIANNGSADIHDLNVNTSGELNITLNPIIFNQRIMENELKSFMAYAVVDENTPNATATITISGGNTSIEIPIEYTKVFGSWPTPPVIDQQSYTASASGFLCVNYQSYTVNLNIPSNIDLDTLLDARIILSFSNACGSDQAHDTYIYFNGYLVAAYFNQAMFGTYTIRGIKPYVRHSNTLYVTSSNYAATGHYCANTNNALRVDVGTTTTYCPEAFCTPTEESETNCDDHIDSDCDGVADCLDQDCCSNSSCEGTGVCTSVENCTDNFDNDGNGLTDCNDVGPCCVASEPSCYGTPACSGVDYWVCDEGNVISQCIINSTKDATTVSVKTLRDLIIGTNGSLVMNESRLTVTNLEVLPNGNITGNLNLTVANLIVHEGGLITASGRYGLEGYGFCNGTGPGAGQSYVTPSYYEGGGGGAYGGYGSASLRGVYSPQFNYIAGGTPYGSIEEPLEKGSSGGNPWGSHYYPYATGGCGGGLIIINASDTVNITGTVESNGGRGEYPPGYSTSGGGGSGGSIYIRANTFTGTGSITANGGTSVMTTAKGGGGSGGRIAIYYWTDSFTGSISSIGGDGWHDSGGPLITIGAAGTIYTKGEDYPLGNLTIANTGKLFPHQATPINGTFEKLTVQNNTNLSIIGGSYTNVGYMDAVINYSIIEIGEGSVFNISDKNLSLYDNSSVYICPTCELDISNYALINDTVYIRAEGNLTVGLDAFDTLGGTIWTNSSINLFYKIENITIIYAGGEFTTVDNNLTVGNLSVLEVETDRTLNFSNLVVEASGTIKHSYNWFTRLYILNITAENITVEAGGTITGDYAGYWREYGPGAGKNATQTESPYSGGGGASHGGLGGRGGGYKPGAGGSVTYGSIEEPIELGSGGGNATGADYDIVYSPLIYTRSAGGGVVILNVTEILNITGDVSADGEQGWDVPSYWAGCGGGSGGSVFINTNTITGDGNITANGGAGNYGSVYGESGGGGGGRIAIYYGINDFNGMITAYGGSPGYIPSPPNPYYVSEVGGAGTIYIKDYNYEVGNLTIDNNNKGLTGTEINGTFEYLNISNAANVTVGD
ncbi:MAG: LamG-like jellyroll fold domain-containing protein, partial [Candidatus Nanoarchaeia archaeon]